MTQLDHDSADGRALRERLADLADQLDAALDSAATVQAATSAFLGQTFQIATYPTTASSYFALHPVAPGGVEAEGSAGTFSADTTLTMFALGVGSAIPPLGTVVLVENVCGRWVFRYDG